VLETDHGVKNALDHFLEMLGVMAVQGHLKHKVHYVFDEGRLAVHLESAYDAFRAHCKRIDYDGEVVDLKQLRAPGHESKKQGGFVVEPRASASPSTADGRRRAVLIDFEKTKVVTADDFPTARAERRRVPRQLQGALRPRRLVAAGVFASSTSPGAPRRRQSRSSVAAFCSPSSCFFVGFVLVPSFFTVVVVATN
jgi:hypothetical protein